MNSRGEEPEGFSLRTMENAEDVARTTLVNGASGASSRSAVRHGLEPPLPPSNMSIFKVVFAKNMFLGRKRHRFFAAVLPMTLQCGISVALYRVFKDQQHPETGTLLL